MSIVVADIDLSAAVPGSNFVIDWSRQTNQSASSSFVDNQAHVNVYNESPCELLVTVGGDTTVQPAGAWNTYGILPSITSITVIVDVVLSGAQVSKLYAVWYAPNEAYERPILGNSPIGGIITGVIAQELQGSGQTLFLTEHDVSGVPTLTPGNAANGTVALSGNDPSGNPQIALQTIGGATPGVTVNGGLTVFTNTGGGIEMILQSGQIVTYLNQATFGAGVPAIIAGFHDVAITTTAINNVLNYFTPNDGQNHVYRVNGWLDLNNGTSGQLIAFQVSYTDPRTGLGNTTPFTTPSSTASSAMNGALSFGNGRLPCHPMVIECKPGTAISINYRDPANTPNDKVSGFVELCI